MTFSKAEEDQSFAQEATVPEIRVPVGGHPKRLFDITASIAALVFFLPAIVLIALAIKAFSPGPVFYGHTRVGFRGRPFKCLKFRTMVINGDEVLARHLHDNPESAIEWQATRKLNRDPRVTPIGRLLRKSSLDELPQFLNVLFGEMSLVGPRPIVTAELAHYGVHADQYLRGKPGVTGLWQISGRSSTSYDQRVKYDVQYVSNWSMQFDAKIALLTIPAVIFQRGSA